MSPAQAVQEAVEPKPYMDEWLDWRDGAREAGADRTKFYKGGWGCSRRYYPELAKKINPKLYKQRSIRMVRRKLKLNKDENRAI
jgi:hypothetical protein